MSQYILLVQNNLKSESTPEEWKSFFEATSRSGIFKGGSEIGERALIGDSQSAKATDHIVGFMRFDSDDKQKVLDLLELHPVVRHGGSVELCEMPKS
ncbi:MAG: hypothetical protein ACSHX9_13850 [Luteolibacter sp.]